LVKTLMPGRILPAGLIWLSLLAALVERIDILIGAFIAGSINTACAGSLLAGFRLWFD
jgi:hypothetical protein